MIDILVPVLGRPQNVVPLVESIVSTTSVDYSLIFICTAGDRQQIEACKQTGARIITVRGGRSEYPRKMNRAFSKTDREFVLLAADDLEFEQGWDVRTLALADEMGVGVIGTNDCANPQVLRGEFSTHPLVRRRYVTEQGASFDGPGVLIHEGYDHNYCDREVCHLAQSRGQWAFAVEARICHRHPCWGTAKPDDVYLKGRRAFRRDYQLFMRRADRWGGTGLLAYEQPRGRRRRGR